MLKGKGKSTVFEAVLVFSCDSMTGGSLALNWSASMPTWVKKSGLRA